MLGVVSNTIPRYSIDWTFLERKSYYVLQAASFLFILSAQLFPIQDKITKSILELAIFFALSNLMDELFFDPQIVGLNEALFAIFITLWTIQKIWTINKTFSSK